MVGSMAGNDAWEAVAVVLEAVLLDGVDADLELAIDLLHQMEEEMDDGIWHRFNHHDLKWTEKKWRETFRFEKRHHDRLCAALHLPDVMQAPCRTQWTGADGLCIVLNRLSYPCRFHQMEDKFGRSRSELSLIFNETVRFLYQERHDLLETLVHPWLTLQRLQDFAAAVHRKTGALQNCVGFIDGTVRPVCRPLVGQRLVYNGHKRVHALKFQSVVVPNGLIANLHGPVEGRRHDAFLLRDSGLLPQLQANFDVPNPQPGEPPVYCLYGDPAYPIRAHLQSPYRHAHLTPEEQLFNSRMSAARVSVEWEFGKVLTLFAFVDFKKNLKLLLQPVGTLYIVSALLSNCYRCLYGSQTATFFSEDGNPMIAPDLEEYLQL